MNIEHFYSCRVRKRLLYIYQLLQQEQTKWWKADDFHTLPWFDAKRLAVNCRLLIISGPSCRKQHSPEPHSASVMQVVASCRIRQNSTQYKNVKKSIFFSQWVCTLVLQFKLINLEYEWIYILKNDYRCSYDSQKRQHNNQKFHCISKYFVKYKRKETTYLWQVDHASGIGYIVSTR